MKKLLKLRDEMKEDLLHADGSVEDGTKMTYGQGFLLYAFSEYVRATGSEEARRYADMTYDYIENECKEGNYYLENARGTGSSNGRHYRGGQPFHEHAYPHSGAAAGRSFVRP